MKSYAIADIRRIFQHMEKQSCEDVPFVLRLESAAPGPVLGITVHTHGNEPSGLAAIHFLLEDFEVQKKLLSGTLFLVVNNVDATRRYLEAENEEEKRLARQVDVNMNRLPEDLEKRGGDMRSEIQRALRLLPIWRKFTVGFDIHSTLTKSPPMIMNVGKNLPVRLIKGFPIRKICSHIDRVHPGIAPACHFYGSAGADIPILGIESGQHEEHESLENARACVLSLLRNLGMLAGETDAKTVEYEEYIVEDAIVFPDESFELTDILCKPFEQFQRIAKGDILAISNDGKRAFLAPFDGHAAFHSKRRPDDITGQAVFLTRPVRKMTI